MATKPNTIDEYLASVDEAKRDALQVLREQILKAAPDAEECISYGQPAFRKGRVICGFGATKKHCAFYMFSGSSLDPFAKELKDYDISKGTIRFQADHPLPPSLVLKLVKARLVENDAANKNKHL
ncbi:MAG: DUF1801 domain-containing protein [Candidatus Thiodiazotropha taylori]|nr:DUF1801 domain-containing protein [Candidatus Thiodiazotropha taylori]MCW4285625.1 DUF1801 domain-containing protein [Candidatus Thiodiazotropha taylori]